MLLAAIDIGTQKPLDLRLREVEDGRVIRMAKYTEIVSRRGCYKTSACYLGQFIALCWLSLLTLITRRKGAEAVVYAHKRHFRDAENALTWEWIAASLGLEPMLFR